MCIDHINNLFDPLCIACFWSTRWIPCQLMPLLLLSPGPCLNIKTVFPKYGDSHVKDKRVMRPSYLQNTHLLFLSRTKSPWILVMAYTCSVRNQLNQCWLIANYEQTLVKSESKYGRKVFRTENACDFFCKLSAFAIGLNMLKVIWILNRVPVVAVRPVERLVIKITPRGPVRTCCVRW